jgi:hypothetical protein
MDMFSPIISTYVDLLDKNIKNFGDIVGFKLSIKSIKNCYNSDNINNLQKGFNSLALANLILNFTVVIFLLFINNLVNLAGTIFALFFMLILFLAGIGVYYYYINDYNSNKDIVNKCLSDNFIESLPNDSPASNSPVSNSLASNSPASIQNSYITSSYISSN